MFFKTGSIRFNSGNATAMALELDNFRPLLLLRQLMMGLFRDDADLLQSVIAGDVASWQKFVLKYANYIYGAINRYCDDDDEKTTVFLHILEKLREDRFSRLNRFEGKAKLSTWLTVVSRRLAIDFLRATYGRDFHLKKIRVVSYDAVPAFLRQLADSATPEKEMAAGEQRRARENLEQGLRQAMRNLSIQESLAIRMVYFKGMKMNEAGKLLQVRSIYKFLARALEKLKDEMESRPQFCRADVAAALGEEIHE